MKKTLSVIFVALLAAGFMFAQEAESKVEHSFGVEVDSAYYFESDPLLESGTNWAPLTGPYAGLEACVIPRYTAKFNIPGNNPLTAGNFVEVQEGVQITPVSVASLTSVKYQPIAFLNFSAGLTIGTGWDCGPIKGGMGVAAYSLDKDGKQEYDPLTPFARYYIEPWTQALFQFDIAAVLPEEKQEWMHIVYQHTFEVGYKYLTGVENGTPYTWILGKDSFNGLKYKTVFTLGYQFPEEKVKVLQLAGVQYSIDGYFKDVAPDYPGFKSDFVHMSISPTMVLKFNEHNSLAIQMAFANRRSFETADTSFTGTVNGTEWTFHRIAFSYNWTL